MGRRTEAQKLQHRLEERKRNIENPERRRAIQHRYITKHREVLLLKKRNYQPEARWRWNKKWRHTHPEMYARERAIHRQKGFVPLAPNIFNVPVDWHHLSPGQSYVVAMPRKVHRAVMGKKHYAFNASVVRRLYGLGET